MDSKDAIVPRRGWLAAADARRGVHRKHSEVVQHDAQQADANSHRGGVEGVARRAQEPRRPDLALLQEVIWSIGLTVDS